MSILFIFMISMNTLLSGTVVWTALCSINHMTPKTRFPIRMGYLLMGVGAFAAMLSPLYFDRHPTVTEISLMAAIAFIRLADHRRRRFSDQLIHR